MPVRNCNMPSNLVKQIDYLGGLRQSTRNRSKHPTTLVTMLRADLENERVTIQNCRQRIRQAEAMGEYALSETLRSIIVQEQEHEIDLCDALGNRCASSSLRLEQVHLVPQIGNFKQGKDTEESRERQKQNLLLPLYQPVQNNSAKP